MKFPNTVKRPSALNSTDITFKEVMSINPTFVHDMWGDDQIPDSIVARLLAVGKFWFGFEPLEMNHTVWEKENGEDGGIFAMYCASTHQFYSFPICSDLANELSVQGGGSLSYPIEDTKDEKQILEERLDQYDSQPGLHGESSLVI